MFYLCSNAKNILGLYSLLVDIGFYWEVKVLIFFYLGRNNKLLAQK